MNETTLSKVPEVTLGFWIIKIFATTLGEVGGNEVTLSLQLGYLVGTVIFGAALIVVLTAQIRTTAVPPLPILGRYHCNDARRNDVGRLLRSLARHRLSRWLAYPYSLWSS